jgi:hypothetical protein
MADLAHDFYTLILSTLLAIKVHSPRRAARSWLHTPCSAKRLRSHAKIVNYILDSIGENPYISLVKSRVFYHV